MGLLKHFQGLKVCGGERESVGLERRSEDQEGGRVAGRAASQGVEGGRLRFVS